MVTQAIESVKGTKSRLALAHWESTNSSTSGKPFYKCSEEEHRYALQKIYFFQLFIVNLTTASLQC